MNWKKSVLPCAALAGLLCGTVSQAHAALIPTLAGGAPTFSGGVYTYTYNVALSADSKVDISRDPAFLTFYDFAGYVSGSATVQSSTAGTSSWNITQQPYGLTGFGTAPVDTSATNITFNFTNPTVYTGSVNPFLVLTLQSTDPLSSRAAQTEYTGQTVAFNNTEQGNIGLVLGPSAGATNTPEPGSIAMLLSVTGSGFLMVRKWTSVESIDTELRSPASQVLFSH